FIGAALAGVAVEIGVLMIMYLKQETAAARARAREEGGPVDEAHFADAIAKGALRRLRPIMMTFAVIFAGLLPIMYGHGAGGEVMRRIAAPMIGGIVSATVLALVVIPAAYFLWNRRALSKEDAEERAHGAVAPAE
ncbi:MAG: efflux RND transporter permease subunit, partial [Parvularculaceae bacterium]